MEDEEILLNVFLRAVGSGLRRRRRGSGGVRKKELHRSVCQITVVVVGTRALKCAVRKKHVESPTNDFDVGVQQSGAVSVDIQSTVSAYI